MNVDTSAVLTDEEMNKPCKISTPVACFLIGQDTTVEIDSSSISAEAIGKAGNIILYRLTVTEDSDNRGQPTGFLLITSFADASDDSDRMMNELLQQGVPAEMVKQALTKAKKAGMKMKKHEVMLVNHTFFVDFKAASEAYHSAVENTVDQMKQQVFKDAPNGSSVIEVNGKPYSAYKPTEG